MNSENQEEISLSIGKEVIAELPQAEFHGRIRVIDNPGDLRSAVRYLMRQPAIGFDTETRPTFRKGRTHNVSLIQLSTPDTCFLFRINKTGLCEPLRNLFEAESVIKIGLSIKDDFHGLHKLGDFNPQAFVELQDYVRQFSIVDASLQKIYAIVFGQRISKSQRLSNWEAELLTDAQQHYAALDAYAALRLYTHLSSGAFDPSQSPYRLTIEENNETEKI